MVSRGLGWLRCGVAMLSQIEGFSAEPTTGWPYQRPQVALGRAKLLESDVIVEPFRWQRLRVEKKINSGDY